MHVCWRKMRKSRDDFKTKKVKKKRKKMSTNWSNICCVMCVCMSAYLHKNTQKTLETRKYAWIVISLSQTVCHLRWQFALPHGKKIFKYASCFSCMCVWKKPYNNKKLKNVEKDNMQKINESKLTCGTMSISKREISLLHHHVLFLHVVLVLDL